ncbi:MAG: hypothetical protein WD990_07715 [Acidimicrobiia bacterium]
MRRTIGTLGAVVALTMGAVPAMAAHDTNPSPRVQTYTYVLDGVANNSDASGWTRLTALPNGKIQVQIHVENMTPGVPHAQHLHGITSNGAFVPGDCPTIADDTSGDGFVNTLEGAPAYGGVQVSLTTSGDTSTASALAVDRFPVANANGVLTYNRTFTPDSPAIWAGLDALEVVVHGQDLNGNGIYDFEAGPSSLTAALPLEATIPAVCGGPGA